MTSPVPFTDNVNDLSNGDGYQFEFRCERCGNGYRSAFVRDKMELGRSALRAVGSFFGGKVADLSHSADQWRYNRSTNSAAKDKALGEAVAEISPSFRQCRGCGDWMCAAQCWNDDIGQCLRCSPSVAEEISRAQADAQRRQIWDRANEVNWTGDLDLATRARMHCSSCGSKVDGGKFCSSCGSPLAIAVSCGGCGSTANRPGSVFCSGCGHRL